MRGLSPAVRNLVIANVVVFALAFLVPDAGGKMIRWCAFWFPLHENFGVWQVVTYMFMHGGIAHIFFNMFALVSFGHPLEMQWGPGRFMVFYFLCGIGAGLIHTGVNWYEYQALQGRLMEAGMSETAIRTMLDTGRYVGPRGDAQFTRTVAELYEVFSTPMVGASGAIYGILVAFGLMYPNARLALLFLPVPIAAKYFIPILIGLDLLSGVTGFSLFGGGIAHFAHVGGALIGFLLMWYWRKRARRAAWHTW